MEIFSLSLSAILLFNILVLCFFDAAFDCADAELRHTKHLSIL